MRAFEIIYNEKQTKIIGKSEIDYSTLTRKEYKDENGHIGFYWFQYDNNSQLRRMLFDGQIYINYRKEKLKRILNYV